MKRTLLIIIGILGALVGLGFVLPAIALLRTTGALPAFEVALLVLGVALTLSGGGVVIYGARKRQA
jgi:hypothetical protein